MAGSHGVPAPGMEVKIVDIETRRDLAPGAIGAIVVRGDTLAIGLDDGTARSPIGSDGWLDTGDLGSFLEGHLFFHGRTDDRIKAKGTNVTPVEVEAALRSIDGVATAYVTGVDLEGTQVVGAVISRATGRSLSEVEVRAACRRLLSSYKVPTLIALIDSEDLPMLSTGKPDFGRCDVCSRSVPHDRDDHRPLHRGVRFSAKALGPSRKSSLLKIARRRSRSSAVAISSPIENDARATALE